MTLLPEAEKGVRMDTHNHALPDAGAWAQRFHHVPHCPESRLYVQRCQEDPELWRVAVKPDEGVWLVAAPEPICPFCGGNLDAPASLDMNVERRHALPAA